MSEADQSQSALARILRYQLAAALYCLLAAAGIAALASYGRLPGHDLVQIAPFIAHLVFNGLVLASAVYLSRTQGWLARSGIVRATSFLVAYGLGIIGLVLAGQAAFGLTRCNAPALLLVVPGLAALLPVLLNGEESHVGAEVLKELPRFPVKHILSGFGGSVLRQTIGWAALLGGFLLGSGWYAILKNVLWDGASYDFFGLARNILTTTIDAWPVVFPLFFLGLVVAACTWGPLLRQIFEQFKEWLGFSGLTSEQRAAVQERLQMLWDYANAPEQEKGSLAGLLLPLIPPLVLVGLGFWLTADSRAVAAWLFPPAASQTGVGWSLIVRDSKVMVWPLLLLFPVAWSLYRLVTDHWPRALHQALISELQSGVTFDASKVHALRRALSSQIRNDGADGTFNPRDYLLARRRRASRRLHATSTVALLLAIFIGWRGLASYTLVTDAGFEDVGFLTGQHFFYRYGDAASVHPRCFLGGSKDVAYKVEFRDGRQADLLYAKELPASLPALKRIDDKLRRSGATFEPLADNAKGMQNSRECTETLGLEYGDPRGFAQIMHVDEERK